MISPKKYDYHEQTLPAKIPSPIHPEPLSKRILNIYLLGFLFSPIVAHAHAGARDNNFSDAANWREVHAQIQNIYSCCISYGEADGCLV